MQEIANTSITPRGFMLLPIGKMVERIHARLKKEGMTEAELPKRREVNAGGTAWSACVRSNALMTTKWRTASRSACATSGAPRR
jgi:hypothetical protein